MKYAPWGRRTVAAIVDGIIMMGIYGAPTLVAISLFSPSEGGVLIGMGLGLIGIIMYLVKTMARSDHNGQTWGKQLLGIRVVQASQSPITQADALRREIMIKQILFGTVGAILLFPLVLNILWPLWDSENQALHDKVAGTHVIVT